MKTKFFAVAILAAVLAGPAAAQTTVPSSYESPGAWWEARTPLERDNYNLNFATYALDTALAASGDARTARTEAQQALSEQLQITHASISAASRDARQFAARGTAIALASTVAMPALASGETGFAVGTGAYDGYGALALNVAHQRGATLYSAGVSTTDDGRTGVKAGAAWKW